MEYKCFASCSFGLESVTSLELKRMQFDNVKASDARVYFNADESGIAKANLWLRTADRVYIELAQFSAVTFDELFEGVKGVALENFIPKDAEFPVDADSVNSALKSVSDIQSICKKASVDRLMQKHSVNKLPETGNRYNIHIKILRDSVSVCLNTSGAGLNRRSYRQANVAAPIRETLAAGIVLLSGYKEGPFCDPMCGSGTIAIEAAMMAAGIAPGLKRDFDAQRWKEFIKSFDSQRRLALEAPQSEYEIYASDMDKRALGAVSRNSQAADVDIKIYHADISDFSRSGCTVITNPPYAQRLGQREQVHELYRTMGIALADVKNKYIITADNDFERYFGKRADKKRKLYNGSIRCTLYQYFK